MSSARNRILDHLRANLGEVVTKDDLQRVAGISEWARRVRELRDEYGYDIRSFKDDPNLRPGEYILTNSEPRPAVRRGISKTQMFRVFERDHHRCVSCGRRAGDPDPTDPDKTVTLVVDHKPGLKGKLDAGEAQKDKNLATFCNVCNEGKWDLYKDYKGTVKLDVVAAVRHASKSEQKKVYDYLRGRFGEP